MTLRPLAFYLPQYHPIPENDAWWGAGFTEWFNVTKAQPCFPGHYQPHRPRELGYYDLRVPEVRERQAELARQHGIYGFCYYHYWFSGRRLLERPFAEVLASKSPDFPFCLCWANENWTRRWDGREGEVLMKQSDSLDADREHIRSLWPAFEDPRYVRVDGRPVFVVYKAAHLKDCAATTAVWREEARRAGIGDLYLLRVDNSDNEGLDARTQGFDGGVEFQPAWHLLGTPLRRGRWHRLLAQTGLVSRGYLQHRVHDYGNVAERMLARKPAPHLRYPGVTPMWDNSARRHDDGVVLANSTPALYEAWLREVVARFRPPTPEENFLFINAWNEWAEGCHLEPDQKHGLAYLEATRRALDTVSAAT